MVVELFFSFITVFIPGLYFSPKKSDSTILLFGLKTETWPKFYLLLAELGFFPLLLKKKVVLRIFSYMVNYAFFKSCPLLFSANYSVIICPWNKSSNINAIEIPKKDCKKILVYYFFKRFTR